MNLHRELLIDGFFIGGPCDQAVGKEVVRSPYDGRVVGTVAEGGLGELRTAVEAAHAAFPTWRRTPVEERANLLRKIADAIAERAEELAELLCDEVGKPIAWARAEVGRTARTFRLAADLAPGFGNEAPDLGDDPRAAGVRAEVRRFPRGVVFAIVPYNWPYNLAAHKIAPALATGNTVVLKPAHQAPLSTLTLARLIHEAGCPPGVLNAWFGPATLAEKVLVEDERISMLSFTGSPKVGWHLKGRLAHLPVSLELGGHASVVVLDDADLDAVVEKVVPGAFGYAGQICISVQHVWATDAVQDALREKLIAATAACPFGDPRDARTVCGPLIDGAAADKVLEWVDEAERAGAKVLVRGSRQATLVAPTLVEGVPEGTRLAEEEVFGPVLTLGRVASLDEAITRLNRSNYGIQHGLFTRDAAAQARAFSEIEAGGLVVNDVPTLRFDALPYGGVKRSGFGREGVRYAMEEMTELRSLVVRT